jgi:hypothetical protein
VGMSGLEGRLVACEIVHYCSASPLSSCTFERESLPRGQSCLFLAGSESRGVEIPIETKKQKPLDRGFCTVLFLLTNHDYFTVQAILAVLSIHPLLE